MIVPAWNKDGRGVTPNKVPFTFIPPRKCTPTTTKFPVVSFDDDDAFQGDYPPPPPSCRDLYGDTLYLTTSGLLPCECFHHPHEGLYATLVLDEEGPDRQPNGSKFASWDDDYGMWVSFLGEGTTYLYFNSDCTGSVTTSGGVLGIGIICRPDLGPGQFEVIGQITAQGGLDEALDNVGVCGDNDGNVLLHGGVITISTSP